VSDESDREAGRKKLVKKINLAGVEDDQNDIHFDAFLGSGYSLRLSTWDKDGKHYICIRRYTDGPRQSQGANIPLSCLESLKTAVNYVAANKEKLLKSNVWTYNF